MNFQTMEYFTAVVEKRSFTKAAESLHITQQTLSAHIANLEKELGCALLIRHIPLELTYAGEVFFRYAADFDQKYASMMHEFDNPGKPAGKAADRRRVHAGPRYHAGAYLSFSEELSEGGNRAGGGNQRGDASESGRWKDRSGHRQFPCSASWNPDRGFL